MNEVDFVRLDSLRSSLSLRKARLADQPLWLSCLMHHRTLFCWRVENLLLRVLVVRLGQTAFGYYTKEVKWGCTDYEADEAVVGTEYHVTYLSGLHSIRLSPDIHMRNKLWMHFRISSFALLAVCHRTAERSRGFCCTWSVSRAKLLLIVERPTFLKKRRAPVEYGQMKPFLSFLK
jgi:hypothetical protein